MTNNSVLTRLNVRPWRLFSLLILGFASGLPLALTGQAMQAWLTTAGMTTATIGMFSLVTQPYVYKFVWAPLMNRFEPPLFGRRRGWLVMTQLLLAGCIWLMSGINPLSQPMLFALVAVLVAFLSSSQDIVIDAYRTDISPENERGLAASMGVFGYRVAMIVSGGVAFILADQLGWAQVYRAMAWIMLAMAAFSCVTPMIPNEVTDKHRARDFSLFVLMMVVSAMMFYGIYKISGWLLPEFLASSSMMRAILALLMSGATVEVLSRATKFVGRDDLRGFAFMLLGAVLGVLIGGWFFALFAPLVQDFLSGLSEKNAKNWLNLCETLIILSFAIPAAYWGAKWSSFKLLLEPMSEYFTKEAAWWFLALLVFYKLGDAFAGTLSTNFLLKGVGFSQTEVGLVNKMLGMFATIGGVVLGGVLMLRWGLWRSLLVFAILQAVSNLGFWSLAHYGQNALGHFTLPTGEFARVLTGNQSLSGDLSIDYLLAIVVGFENITGGMGTAAFVALLMGLSRGGHSLTYYALLSALASLGRIYVGPVAGVLAEPENLGWANFFIFATLMGFPAVLLLLKLRQKVHQLS